LSFLKKLCYTFSAYFKSRFAGISHNLTSENIELLGFEKRAKNLNVYDRLLNANIIPHGGGYVLPDILTVNKVIEVDGKRYFEVEMQNDRGKKIISEVRELPYEYRG
jgi:hypothetical protein